MQFKRSVLTAATVALAASVLPAMAKPFKWAGSSDIQTMDIHSQNSALGNGIHGAVYESLVMFNSRTLKVEPVLATSWQQVSPTQMRFKLRQGVKFSDGSAMTADDVVYSLQRAMSKTSTYAIYTQGMDRIAKVDGETIDIFLKNPNPVLLNQLTELRVMSRAWAEKHNSVEPKDIKSKEETYSHRHAMGTGPFVLKEWVPDQKIVFTANPHWWNAGKVDGNVTEITYTPIKSEATRIAALLSGEVDMVRDTSIQDLARTKTTGADGSYNLGRYSNERMDYIVDRVKTETDLPVRNRLLTEGLQLHNDDVVHIPLHNQMLAWAMKKNVELVQRPDNRIDWRLIKVN